MPSSLMQNMGRPWTHICVWRRLVLPASAVLGLLFTTSLHRPSGVVSPVRTNAHSLGPPPPSRSQPGQPFKGVKDFYVSQRIFEENREREALEAAGDALDSDDEKEIECSEDEGPVDSGGSAHDSALPAWDGPLSPLSSVPPSPTSSAPCLPATSSPSSLLLPVPSAWDEPLSPLSSAPPSPTLTASCPPSIPGDPMNEEEARIQELMLLWKGRPGARRRAKRRYRREQKLNGAHHTSSLPKAYPESIAAYATPWKLSW
ncbi:hypothetical protein HGRIS_011996 [Hohenbuehelia grisea]|uniref:Uncharacterized protein n=1 Tax=Hohenbuehelia grisea TaxID=104357 RepID=A0ABR3JWY5_9AGAR